MRNGKKRSVVGDPINFRGMAHAPTNEAGVVALFSMVARDLGYHIQEIKNELPDCIARRESAQGWEEVAIEFEFDIRRFLEQGHDPTRCDMIVCWRHSMLDCPADLEVMCLADQETSEPAHRPLRSPLLSEKHGRNVNCIVRCCIVACANRRNRERFRASAIALRITGIEQRARAKRSSWAIRQSQPKPLDFRRA